MDGLQPVAGFPLTLLGVNAVPAAERSVADIQDMQHRRTNAQATPASSWHHAAMLPVRRILYAVLVLQPFHHRRQT